MRFVSYTRAVPWFSRGESKSIPEQNEFITAAVNNIAGAKLIKKYTDKKYDKDADTAFEEMISDGMERKYDGVIVYDFYYMGRSYDSARKNILETLIAIGIRIIVVVDDFDTEKIAIKDAENAEFYDYTGEVTDYFLRKRRELHGDIWKDYRSNQDESYVMVNSIPYGYMREPYGKGIVKDTEIQNIVEGMFAKAIAGESFNAIAGWLNWENVETPDSRRRTLQGKDESKASLFWTGNKVREILRNPVYTGAVCNAFRGVLCDGAHEAYVSGEDFLKIKGNVIEAAKLDENGKKVRAVFVPKTYGTIYCKRCGEIIRLRPNEKGENVYRCTTKCAGSEAVWRQSGFLEDELEPFVRKAVESEKQKARDFIKKVSEGGFREIYEKEKERLSFEMHKVLADIDISQIDRVPLYDKKMNRSVSESEYKKAVDEYRQLCSRQNELLEDVMAKLDRIETLFTAKNDWCRLFVDASLPESISRADVSRYIAFMDVDPIEFGKSKTNSRLRIHFKCEEFRDAVMESEAILDGKSQ